MLYEVITPLLQVPHFLLEAGEENNGYQGREAEDEEGQDHDQRAVGQLESRVHEIDHRDDRHQQRQEGADA